MKFTTKMHLVPVQKGRGEGEESENDDPFESLPASQRDQQQPQQQPKGNSIRKYAADRQRKMLTVVLKLALVNGYDDSGMMKTLDGDDMDIIPLLIYALSPGRNVTGLADFVSLLHDAGVTPEDVINSHVKDLLARRRAGPRFTYKRRRQPRPPPPPPPTRQVAPVADRPADDHQLPLLDEHMDARTKRTFDAVDSDSDEEDESSKRPHNQSLTEPPTAPNQNWNTWDSDDDKV